MEEREGKSAASVRVMEICTAVVVLLFGLLVVYDSQRLGAQWGDDGPQPGYFPFYIGVLICVSAIVTLAAAIRNRSASAESFVSRAQLKLILAVLVPTIVYVALISYLGLYVTSAFFIAFFMWWLGKYSWWKTALVSIGVMLAFFLTFELWFSVPLPKGPLEAALGFG